MFQLNLLLYAYAVEHHCLASNDDFCQKYERKYAIIYNFEKFEFDVWGAWYEDYLINAVYFTEESCAKHALEDIVIPFCKKHPELFKPDSPVYKRGRSNY